MSVLSFDSVGLWLFCVKERKENEPGFEVVLRTKDVLHFGKQYRNELAMLKTSDLGKVPSDLI